MVTAEGTYNRDTMLRVSSTSARAMVMAAACFFTAGCRPSPETSTGTVVPQGDAAFARVTGTTTPGALVTLESIGTASPALPPGPAVLDQYSKQFVPDLLFVRVGQVVEFRNSEDENHNIQVLRLPTGTTVMNESGSKGQVFRHTFEQPGTFDVNCDVHPGMRATIVATHTPFAAMASGSGGFTIDRVPPGKYVLKSIMNGRETTREIAVTAPSTAVERL
jgi:hypothetical protein